jgi:hypothetical protein
MAGKQAKILSEDDLQDLLFYAAATRDPIVICSFGSPHGNLAAFCSSSPVGTLSNSFHGRSRVSHDLRFRQGRQLAGALKDASVDYDRIDIFG